MNSRWLNGNLVFQKNNHIWYDATGPTVRKYLTQFVNLPTDDTTGDPTEWTATVVEVGAGTSTAVLDTVAGGGLLMTTAGNEDDGIQLQLKGEAFQLAANDYVYFGTRIKLSSATESDLLVGLAITDTSLLTAVTDAIYFECLDSVTDTFTVTEINNTETTSAASVGTMDTSYHTYEFFCNGISGVYFYLDGALVATHTANIPTDEVLTPSIAFLTGSAAAITCSVDWLRVIKVM